MLDKIKILGHEYTVSMDSSIQLDDGHNAQINLSTCEIKIGDRQVKSKQEEGFIHEIIEALNSHLELMLEHSKISQLSEGLYQVLKDNGLLKILW